MKNLENKVIYQIYPKSFLDTTGNGIGDLKGIIRKLGYLSNLGVDYIWLSPICRSPQRDNGYDIADYYQIDPLFGTNEDYETLIREAGTRGIKIMMDLVLNHTSDEHEWFQKALNGDEKYYGYYIFRNQPNEIESYFGGKAWAYCEELKQYYFRLFDKSQPDLNWENPKVREDIYKMVNFWIDKGVEGFRLDVIDLIGKEPDHLITSKGPRFYEYLQDLNHNTFGKELLTVGECWGSTPEDSSRMCNENGLTQAFHFNHLTLIDGKDKWYKKSLKLQELADVLNIWQNDETGIEAVVMNNHDLPRLISNWFDDDGYRVESAKLAITLFGLMRGNLYLYQGEEIGMTNAYMTSIEEYRDVETLNKYEELKRYELDETIIMDMISRTSRDNARTPMQWSGETQAGFTMGTPWLAVNKNYKDVNVVSDLESEDSVYCYYQKIIGFRKEQYSLIDQKARFYVDGDVFYFVKGNLKFMANFSKFVLPVAKTGVPIFTNYKTQETFHLRPFEVMVTLGE